MNIIRDVLDNQLVDRKGYRMGRVDGIVMELRDGQPPKLAYIEVGISTLAQRLHPHLASWVAKIHSMWGAKRDESVRIPWSKVREIGIDVEVDVDADKTRVIAYEQWVREHITKRIPGGK
jgi:sporulation protein YlmC with PRC-barrel domain